MLTTDHDSLAVLIDHNDWIICNKQAGIPSTPDKSGDNDMLSIAEHYVGKTLFPVHRLDRPVSGCILFSKTKASQHRLSQPGAMIKRYLAVIPSGSVDPQGMLRHHLVHDKKARKARCYDVPVEGSKIAELTYHTTLALERYDVLHIELGTGRFHQIRAQLAAIGLPVRGDVKYGARRSNPDRSIDLHAYQLIIPESGTFAKAHRKPVSPLWEHIFGELQ